MGKSRVPHNWTNSTRSRRLPSNWPDIRARVLARDGAICWVCHGPGADEVDHKVRGDDHSLGNLAPIHQAVYPFCHRKKSSAEGNYERWKYRERRPAERHPGLS
jgi:5-methylcytosine-specific restriction protein A